ncbi:hypothetical protein [Neptunicella sp. SCSIO 80796]|uniref:hypothetical protein n=1 Tax=Neptunicella plasticusilytica TaxID=3117012 RepID=UPI003A4DAB67
MRVFSVGSPDNSVLRDVNEMPYCLTAVMVSSDGSTGTKNINENGWFSEILGAYVSSTTRNSPITVANASGKGRFVGFIGRYLPYQTTSYELEIIADGNSTIFNLTDLPQSRRLVLGTFPPSDMSLKDRVVIPAIGGNWYAQMHGIPFEQTLVVKERIDTVNAISTASNNNMSAALYHLDGRII